MTRELHKQLHFILPLICILAFACNFYVINAIEIKLQGMFVFGSSIVDNGNNNNGLARGNYLPYGIDFKSGPTGRFSNGKNVADQVASLLSLHPVKPFLALEKNDSQITSGVNFASGASGILEETSMLLGVKSLSHQIQNFKHVALPRLEKEVEDSRYNVLGEYLFVVAAGDNDFSYYHTLHQDQIWGHHVFAAKLISSYYDSIKTLYELGARNFLVLSVHPVGCNPSLTKGGDCIHHLNAAVDRFYDQLVNMVMQSKQDMSDAKIIAVNSGKIVLDAIESKNTSGFSNVNTPCCEIKAEGTCKKNGRVCKNRREFVYFDGLHLTETASDIIASKAYYSRDNSEVYPGNLQSLLTPANK